MRTLLVVSLAIIGAGVGLAGDMLFWQDATPTPVRAGRGGGSTRGSTRTG